MILIEKTDTYCCIILFVRTYYDGSESLNTISVALPMYAWIPVFKFIRLSLSIFLGVKFLYFRGFLKKGIIGKRDKVMRKDKMRKDRA